MNWLQRWWGFLRATTNPRGYQIVEIPCVGCPRNLVETYHNNTLTLRVICPRCGTKYTIEFHSDAFGHFPVVDVEEA